MWDMFTPEPNFAPWTYFPRTLPEEITPPGIKGTAASKGLDFIDPDEAVGLMDILWESENERKLIELARKELEDISKSQKEWNETWMDFHKILEELREQQENQ